MSVGNKISSNHENTTIREVKIKISKNIKKYEVKELLLQKRDIPLSNRSKYY